MNKKLLVISIGVILTGSNAYADNATIGAVNNQAFIDGQFGSDRLTYSNHPADAGAPLYNAQNRMTGALLGLTKTFGHVYSQFTLGANKGTLNYSDSSLNDNPLSSGHSVTLSLGARLGYSFFQCDTVAVTPYLLAGYTHNQLDTGGNSSSFITGTYNGATLLSQSFYYGVGILNQWAATPKWVLSVDAQLGTQNNPSANGYVNNFNNQPSATTTYQQWNLSTAQFWQVGLGSDYLVTHNLHFRAGFAYGYHNVGGSNTISTGVFPSEHHQFWLGNVGLGYSFADMNITSDEQTGGDQGAIHAANNQGSLHLGYLRQNFSGGTTLNSYTQTIGAPTLGVVFSKTSHALFTQIAADEAIGVSSYQGQNTIFDASGKLGYQFTSSSNTALTPYATLGYHRGFQNIKGMPSDAGAFNGLTQTSYINGTTETYQHSWYGIGLIAQWAVSPKWVLSVDGNIGRIFNASMHSWTPLSLLVSTSYSLGNTTYQMIDVGADYLIAKNWHVQGNMGYWHYRYNPSSANTFGISTVTDTTRQINANVGVGYSFG